MLAIFLGHIFENLFKILVFLHGLILTTRIFLLFIVPVLGIIHRVLPLGLAGKLISELFRATHAIALFFVFHVLFLRHQIIVLAQ
jgi:hypothetical protein